jgi:hypothetical protein
MSEQHAKIRTDSYPTSHGGSPRRPRGRRVEWNDERRPHEEGRETGQETPSGVLAELKWGRES